MKYYILFFLTTINLMTFGQFKELEIIDKQEGLFIVKNNRELIGVCDENENWIIHPAFTKIEFSGSKWLKIKDYTFWYLFDRAGKNMTPKGYLDIYLWDDSTFLGKDSRTLSYQKKSIINSSRVSNENYSALSHINKHFILTTDSNLEVYNLKNELLFTDKIVNILNPNYANNLNLLEQQNTIFIRGQKDSLRLYRNGKFLTNQTYKEFKLIDSEKILATNETSSDILNYDGEIIKNLKIGNAEFYKYWIYSAYSPSNFAYNQVFEEVLLPAGTKSCQPFERLLRCFTEKFDIINVIDQTGKLLQKNSHWVEGNSEKLLIFKENEVLGWTINDTVIKPQYTTIKIVNDSLLIVNDGFKFKLVNSQNKKLPFNSFDEFKYPQLTYANYNTASLPLFAVRNEKKWRVFGGDLQQILDGDFDSIELTSLGFTVKKEDYFQIFDLKGRPLIQKPFKFRKRLRENYEKFDDYTYKFDYERKEWIPVADDYEIKIGNRIYKDSIVYILDSKGSPVVNFTENDIIDNYPFFKVKANEKFNYYYPNGHIVLNEPVDYLASLSYKNISFLACTNNNCDIYDTNQKKVKNFSLENFEDFGSTRFLKFTDENSILKIIDLETLEYLSYQDISKFENLGFKVMKNNKWGIVDFDFKEIIGCEYERINFVNNYLYVHNSNGEGIYSKEGELCVPVDKYNSYISETEDYFIVDKNNLSGIYFKKTKRWIAPNVYEDIISCDLKISLNKKYLITRVNGLYGLNDDQCNVLIENKYKSLKISSSLLILEEKDGKLYFSDPETLLPINSTPYISYTQQSNYTLGFHNYENWDVFRNSVLIDSFKTNFCEFSGNGKLQIRVPDKSYLNGIWDIEAKQFDIQPLYQRLYSFGDFYKIYKEEKQGIIDKQGTQIVPLLFNEIEQKNGFFLCKSNLGKTVFEKGGKNVFGKFFKDIFEIDFGNKVVLENEDSSLICDINFNIIMGGEWKIVGDFRFGLAPVKKGKLYGYINEEGIFTIKPKYRFTSEFVKENNKLMAQVILGNEFLIISNTGEVLKKEYLWYSINRRQLESSFAELNPSLAFKLYAQSDSVEAKIKSEWNKIFPELSNNFPWDEINTCGPFLYIINEKNRKKGLINILAKPITKIDYDEFEVLSDVNFQTIIKFRKGTKYGFISTQGKELTGAIYDEIGLGYNKDTVVYKIRIGEKISYIDKDFKPTILEKFD